MNNVKAAILGFGGMARGHLHAYQRLKKENAQIELIALCDINPNQFEREEGTNIETAKKEDLSGLRLYTDCETMLKSEPELDMIDICLPSYLHCKYTVMMLKKGYHVLCEKPMSLHASECEEMILAAEKSGKKLMIGQCLRFDPNYVYLKETIESGTFGNVRHAHFSRLSSIPLWGFEKWYQDTARSGGCATDLHIHDVDMIRFLFGEPNAVSAVATEDRTKWQVINSRFHYGNGTLIVADGSWDEARTFPFEMSYRVRFDRAEVVFDGTNVTVYPDEGAVFTPERKNASRITEEIRCLGESILGHAVSDRISPYEAAKTVALVELLCKSADQNGETLKNI